MKISQLIVRLTEIMEGHGDNEVFVSRNQVRYTIDGSEAAFIDNWPEPDENFAVIIFKDRV